GLPRCELTGDDCHWKSPCMDESHCLGMRCQSGYVVLSPSWNCSRDPLICPPRQSEHNRVHHDLGYTVPSTKGGTDHVTLPRDSYPYDRAMRFDELDHGRVCGPGASL